MTKEHVFPEWLLKHIPGEGKIVHEWIAPEGSDSADRRWETDVLDFKANVVCADCNHGWMNDLENAARPFLVSMIKDNGRNLYDNGRKQVAYWALKTAMMIDFSQESGHRSVPQADYPALYETRGLLPGTFVWLAACSFGAGATAHHRTLHVSVDDSTVAGYGATINVGHLVIEVIRVEIERGKALKIGGKLAPALVSIWPQNETVTWPPALYLNRQQAVWLGQMIEAVPIFLDP